MCVGTGAFGWRRRTDICRRKSKTAKHCKQRCPQLDCLAKDSLAPAWFHAVGSCTLSDVPMQVGHHRQQLKMAFNYSYTPTPTATHLHLWGLPLPPLIAVCTIGFTVEYCWAAGEAVLVPYLSKQGVRQWVVSTIYLSNPTVGRLGAWLDRLNCRIPFVVGLSAIASAGIITLI